MAKAMGNQIDVEDKYGFIKQIGKGSYGEAWLVVPLDCIATGRR
ncbi:unnamed protein product, partial [Rotaria sp. Silwood2]